MIIIEVKKGENIDIALKRLKSKFKRTKVADELRERMYYEKPSVKRRNKVQKAKYLQKIKDQENKLS
jgi:small subunit ribosomal protein S21